MSVPAWREEAITRSHDRKAFDCGDKDLNDYLRLYARQGHESGSAKTFLAIDSAEPRRILGFYSVAPAQLEFARLPVGLRRGLARHEVGGFRLARLATDRSIQGHGLGGQLLVAAARRCLNVAEQVGGVVLIIDAKSDRAAAWYESYGAVRLDDTPQTLVMALATFRRE